MEEHPGRQGQSKIEKAQKINGFLNIFGVYYYTKLLNVYTFLQEENRKTVSGFYQTDRLKIQFRYKTDISILDNISIHRIQEGTRNNTKILS